VAVSELKSNTYRKTVAEFAVHGSEVAGAGKAVIRLDDEGRSLTIRNSYGKAVDFDLEDAYLVLDNLKRAVEFHRTRDLLGAR
jgi:hypothetical protein